MEKVLNSNFSKDFLCLLDLLLDLVYYQFCYNIFLFKKIDKILEELIKLICKNFLTISIISI